MLSQTMRASTHPQAAEFASRVKAVIVEAARRAPSNIDELLSVFLIGSGSGAAFTDDWYQDFDVHFRFKPTLLRQDTLIWLADLLHRCECLQDGTCKIKSFVRDRHWKMVPDSAWPVNVGVHATLLSAADHVRRVHYNPILSQNMYVRCAVLWGAHPRELVGFRPAVPADYVHSAGGIGWMVENFTRMVALHILEPTDRTFYPFVAGYCWNAASTLMFHLATLEAPGIYSRVGAYDRFLQRTGLPKDVRYAAERLYELKELPDNQISNQCDHINAAARVVTYTAREALHRTQVECAAAYPTVSNSPRVLYSERVGARLGKAGPVSVVNQLVPDSTDDFYSAIRDAISLAAKTAGCELSIKENFELLRDYQGKTAHFARLRLWTNVSAPRQRLSFDFARERGEPTLECTLFNWEDGAQALLQRICEIFIEGRGVTSELRRLAAAVASVVNERATEIGLKVPKELYEAEESGDFNKSCSALAHLLAPHVMKHQQMTLR
jgi:hypothetical protein